MTLLEELQRIVGKDYVSDDKAIAAAYSRDQHWSFVPPKNPAYVVRPGSKEEIRKVLMLANDRGVPVIPWSTGINIRGMTTPARDGSIMLDVSRLNQIVEINPEMMAATIQPGVTFGMLVEQTKKYGLRPAFPDAPMTVSAVTNNYLRGIYQTAPRDGLDHVLSFEIILPNGETLQTGSRLLCKDLPYFRYGPGPEIASLFIAGPGTWGVVTELTLKLYRIFEHQKVYYVGFDDVDTPMELLDRVSREELVSGCRFVDTAHWLPPYLGTYDYEYEKLPEFVAVLVVENQDKVFQAQDELVRGYIDKSGGEILDLPRELADNLKCEMLGAETSPMIFGFKGNFYCVGYYGPLKLLSKYYKDFKQNALEMGFEEADISFYANTIARFHGQSTYYELEIYFDSYDKESVEKLRALHAKTVENLLNTGIYGWFRPYAGVIEPTLERIGNFADYWKRLQALIDPKGIMNPGKLF
jgi:FAD/FMN-containing dehydrogenase